MMTLWTLALAALFACSDKADGEGGDDTSSPPGDSAGDVDGDGDGYTPNQGDCDDEDPNRSPATPEEMCDGIDQNCDGIDLDDVDGDSHTCSGVGGDDCDDFDPTVYPGAPDECGDGQDMDCDQDPECDCDADGFEGAQCEGEDCDDADSAAYPGATDACYDGIDADCDAWSDYDCDGDGYASADYEGEDCDDSDYRNYPGGTEICYDGADNDCDDSTADCDCDGDGHDDASCGGDDCDDAAETVYPSATEAYADNLDNDCDSEVDEGAYCNPYAPLTNVTTGASKEYDVVYDGSVLTEVVTPTSYDPSTYEAALTRDWTGSLAYNFTEHWTCAPSDVSLDAWEMSLSGIPFTTVSFSQPRIDLLDASSLIAGTAWDYSYTADDPSFGTLWLVTGTMTVQGFETLTVAAGTFDALVITNDYRLTDSLYALFDRSGAATYYYVERLGLIYSEDVTTEGALFESRELTGYTGFYP